MFNRKYSEYINTTRKEIYQKKSLLNIDCTSDNFPFNDKLNILWKKLLLKIANSNDLSYYLTGDEYKEELLKIISEKYTNISDYRLNKNNCTFIRNKYETLKAICNGGFPIPLYSPNILFKYNLDKKINEALILKPEIDTNLEPGYFEYKYENVFMINSNYVIVQNPDHLTGKFITKQDIILLRDSLLQRKSVLIVDTSLGNLFPDLIYGNETPSLIEGVIYINNFSPTGLTGDEINLVISNEIIISKIKEYIKKSPATDFKKSSPLIFQLLLESMKNNELASIFQNWIKTEIYSRLKLTKDNIIEQLSYSYPVFVHNFQGGTSLWLYFKNLPLGDIAIANLLKAQGLIVKPGSFFYPEKLKNWKHSRECIGININGAIGRELDVVNILKSVISKCYAGKI